MRLHQEALTPRSALIGTGNLVMSSLRVPHDGVSVSFDCMTYSVGFRAPTQKDLLISLAERATDTRLVILEVDCYQLHQLGLLLSRSCQPYYYYYSCYYCYYYYY